MVEPGERLAVRVLVAIHQQIALGPTATKLGDDVAFRNERQRLRPDLVVARERLGRLALLEVDVTEELGGEEGLPEKCGGLYECALKILD